MGWKMARVQGISGRRKGAGRLNKTGRIRRFWAADVSVGERKSGALVAMAFDGVEGGYSAQYSPACNKNDILCHADPIRLYYWKQRLHRERKLP
jgi:hypothetical protein